MSIPSPHPQYEFDDYHYACLDSMERMLTDAREAGSPTSVQRLQEVLNTVLNAKWYMSFMTPVFLEGEMIGAELMGYVSRDFFYTEFEAGRIEFDPVVRGYRHVAGSGSFAGRMLCSDLTVEQIRGAAHIPSIPMNVFTNLMSQMLRDYRRL